MHMRIIASAAIALAAVACANTDRAPGTASDSTTARADTRIVVVTHGQSSDPFWSVVANGVGDAAKDLGVRVEYQAPTSFDMVRMSEIIDAAIASKPAALIVSVPDPAALGASIRKAVAAGIPAIGINAGADAWESLGLLGYIGQTEYEAGHGGGERLVQAGSRRVLCVNHEVGTVSQDERCRGLGEAVGVAGGRATVLAVDLADPDDAQQRISGALSADPSLDGILTLGPAASPPALAALRATGRLASVR
jgi:simple sugar transport system substrate-binding protein